MSLDYFYLYIPGRWHAVLIVITLSSNYSMPGRIPCLTHEERDAEREAEPRPTPESRTLITITARVARGSTVEEGRQVEPRSAPCRTWFAEL